MARKEDGHATEYYLLIRPEVNEGTGKHTTLVRLETATAFASFQYDIAVRATAERKTIRLKVLGLKTPDLSLPTSGRARYEQEFEALAGTYTIVVEGIDGRSNTFGVRIGRRQVKVLTVPPRPFVTVRTGNEHPPEP